MNLPTPPSNIQYTSLPKFCEVPSCSHKASHASQIQGLVQIRTFLFLCPDHYRVLGRQDNSKRLVLETGEQAQLRIKRQRAKYKSTYARKARAQVAVRKCHAKSEEVRLAEELLLRRQELNRIMAQEGML